MAAQINFTTGPVRIAKHTAAAFNQTPISHRSSEFRAIFEDTRKRLCLATKANDVIIMSGSGTLANEAMIAQIAQSKKPGLVLVNGEFGNRLAKQCSRYQMNFSLLEKEWGMYFSEEEIREVISEQQPSWLLFCHHETSTGVINNLPLLTQICKEHQVELYADCISSVGNTEVDLSGVAMASTSSGKGLAAFPGLAMVFVNTAIKTNTDIPGYINLETYIESNYMPFTINSNLLLALNASIDETLRPQHWQKIAQLSAFAKRKLIESGYQLVNMNPAGNAFVFTILIENGNSYRIGEALKEQGLLISYESTYLLSRNMIQVSVMGSHDEHEVQSCIEQLNRLTIKPGETVLSI